MYFRFPADPLFFLAQSEIRDTVYFDDNFSVCEKPVALMYRASLLNRDKFIFYTGSTTDYYMNGQVAMKGQYDVEGKKQGLFRFYRTNGKLSSEGKYENNEMKGFWNFYDANGNKTAQFDCNNSTDFTPTLLITKKGDTILQNGNGKFSLNTLEDFPEIFSVPFTIEGNVINGKKDNAFVFSTIRYGKEFKRTDYYANGIFKNATQLIGSENTNAQTPLSIISLANNALFEIESFHSTNLVFSYNSSSQKNLVNYLATGETPFIQVQTKSFQDNETAIFSVFKSVFQTIVPIPTERLKAQSYPLGNSAYNLSSFAISLNESPIDILQIHANASITIDTSGSIVRTAFIGNIPQKKVNEISYYLSRLKGLSSYVEDTNKQLSNIDLKFYTLIDTLKTGNTPTQLSYNYIVEDNNAEDSSSYYVQMIKANANPAVDIQAKFLGGSEAWIKYLQHNLHADVAYEHHAPSGSYAVVVSFLVDLVGNVSEVKAENDPGYGTAAEAVRVIAKSPKWQPAIKDGKNISYRQRLTLTFDNRH